MSVSSIFRWIQPPKENANVLYSHVVVMGAYNARARRAATANFAGVFPPGLNAAATALRLVAAWKRHGMADRR